MLNFRPDSAIFLGPAAVFWLLQSWCLPKSRRHKSSCSQNPHHTPLWPGASSGESRSSFSSASIPLGWGRDGKEARLSACRQPQSPWVLALLGPPLLAWSAGVGRASAFSTNFFCRETLLLSPHLSPLKSLLWAHPPASAVSCCWCWHLDD